MLKTFFTAYLSECVNPGGRSHLTVLHVLQESFEPSVDNWPARAHACFGNAPGADSRFAYCREDLGLFSELVVGPLECDSAVVCSPQNASNVPVCPDCYLKEDNTTKPGFGCFSLRGEVPIDRSRPIVLSHCGTPECHSVLLLSATCHGCQAPSTVAWQTGVCVSRAWIAFSKN